MTWYDSSSDPHRTSTRSIYVPPPLRNNSATTLGGYSPDSTHFFSRSAPSQHGSSRARGGCRGRGSGGRSHRWPSLRDSLPPNPNQRRKPLGNIRENFDELEMIDDEEDDGDRKESNVVNLDAYEDIPVESSGSNIPSPVSRFEDIDLGEALAENINRCKYVKPTPIQKHAIPIAMAGRDLMACAQTGSGKTAAFCFPIISGISKNRFRAAGSGHGGSRIVYPSALILSPTRELSCQIHEEAKKFARNTGVKIVVAYGGASIVQQLRNLEKGVDILVATPGRLVDMIERARVSLRMIQYFALDEADRMLDMGFEPQIRKIVQQMGMPPPGERQTMLFSATFPCEIQRLASDFLSDYIFLTVGRVGSSTELIEQRVELVQDMDKRTHLIDILRVQKVNGTRSKRALTLVFVETKRGADALEHWLSMNGFPAISIHGDKVQVERERALKSFKSGATPILVATDVASRGLDVPHVSHVINFDLPKDIDDYVHRIGRTGRAGKSGLATAFFNDKNTPLAKALVELMKEANQQIPSWLTEYAENSSYNSGGGRGKRYGVGKFGGYDFRSGAQSGSDNYYYSSEYTGSDSAVDYTASNSGAFGYYNGANTDYYCPPPNDVGYESVVASGWD